MPPMPIDTTYHRYRNYFQDTTNDPFDPLPRIDTATINTDTATIRNTNATVPNSFTYSTSLNYAQPNITVNRFLQEEGIRDFLESDKGYDLIKELVIKALDELTQINITEEEAQQALERIIKE